MCFFHASVTVPLLGNSGVLEMLWLARLLLLPCPQHAVLPTPTGAASQAPGPGTSQRWPAGHWAGHLLHGATDTETCTTVSAPCENDAVTQRPRTGWDHSAHEDVAAREARLATDSCPQEVLFPALSHLLRCTPGFLETRFRHPRHPEGFRVTLLSAWIPHS